MIQTQGTQSLVESHRRDLVASAGPRRGGARGEQLTRDTRAGARSVEGTRLPGGSARHRPVAPRLGAWLIHFGTKLGGATVRTS